MNEFLTKNAVGIIIAVVGVVSSYAVYGFQISAATELGKKNEAKIEALNAQQVQLQVQLAQIATDIQYIKANIDRLLK